MWKLPFNIHGAEVYSEIVFKDVDEVMTRFGPTITNACKKLETKHVMVGKLLINKNQIIALPSSLFDQRNLWIEDVPGVEFDDGRPVSIQF